MPTTARPRLLATYRLQFNKDFTFQDAAKIVDYLADLGITHVYASPILTAGAAADTVMTSLIPRASILNSAPKPTSSLFAKNCANAAWA